MKPAFDSPTSGSRISLRRARPLLGTFVEIAGGGGASADLNAAIDAAFADVAYVHRLMSFHEPDSDVGRLNREASARAVSVHPWTYAVLRLARELHEASAGVFDVGVAPVLQERGLLPCVPGERHAGPRATGGGQPLELLPGARVRFRRRDVRIDLGGIAKGFAVDRAIQCLQDRGVPRGLVNAGGDLAAFGPDACAVHLRDPRDPRRLLCRVALRNEALASSGGCFDPFQSSEAMATAVIDPSTREPARAVQGATVRAPSCMVADALTKVIMVAGESAAALLAQYGARAMFVSADDGVRVTRDWQDAGRYGV